MSYQLMFQKAVELQQNGALNEAEHIYRQILETAPDNADVLNLLGLIAQTRGIHNEAVNYFYKAAESAPHHFPIYFNLAVSLGALGKYMEAHEAYQKVLQLKPDCKEACFGIGNLYWQQNNLEAAAKAYRQALDIDSQYTEARTNLYEIENDIENLQKIADGNPMALYYLGRRTFNDKDFTGAAAYLASADKLTTDDEIKAMLGEALLQTGEPDTAHKLFLQAQNLNSQNLTAVLNLADMAAEKHQFGEAEKYYQRAIELDPRNLRAHANYANMLCQSKRTLEALEQYRHAVIIAPQTPELSYNLSLILKTLEEYEQALDLMFHAFYLAPTHDDWALNIAETLITFYQKAPEKALKITENWYQKMPENIIVKHLWATLHQQPSEVSKEYNTLLFNNFAATYEQTLGNIHYNVVAKIAELYAPMKGRILDLGCGTGLVAAALKNNDNRFTGVDIAENMLAIARQKNIYDTLLQTDILSYLQGNKQPFDVIIAADVFCYFGDLQPILQACHPTRLIFSVEVEKEAEGYKIYPQGRYKHNPEAIEKLLTACGYTQIQKHPLILRQENGVDVDGMIFEAV
ncbi:MAG: tetratricopeptide repeat protein [Alphaproteobacteria bacterium]|nr:tetratricopeptide repeat protein [Alphaproteobacteria bacterium]